MVCALGKALGKIEARQSAYQKNHVNLLGGILALLGPAPRDAIPAIRSVPVRQVGTRPKAWALVSVWNWPDMMYGSLTPCQCGRL